MMGPMTHGVSFPADADGRGVLIPFADPAAVAAMVRTPGLAVIVDGYNVSMLAWPEASAADQRDRLCDALVEFQLRVRCEVTVVFDGADVSGVRPLRRRGLRVVFSAAAQEADEVVVGEAMFRPAEVPVQQRRAVTRDVDLVGRRHRRAGLRRNQGWLGGNLA